MLAVILKIMSILGIILLILLGVILFVLLLVLFMPIGYKANAVKSDSEIIVNVRVRWLFGLLRVRYDYPDPGKVIAKILWITIYDSGKQPVKKKNEATEQNMTASEGSTDTIEEQTNGSETVVLQEQNADGHTEETQENKEESLKDKLFAKFEKIKYTIQQFCAKIKHIWDNIKFYKKLLLDEQTKLLISHACRRVGKVLRHIRPRKLKADVIFGTGSPDTTGYAYGVYGMFSPQLGKNVLVVPDFTQKILTGTFKAAGHITIVTVLINVLAVLLDKRLQLLNRRLKAHSAKQTKPTN